MPSQQSQSKRAVASTLHTEIVAVSSGNKVVDWLRTARNKKKLEAIGCSDTQTQITDFCSVLEDIDRLTHENEKLSFLLFIAERSHGRGILKHVSANCIETNTF